MEQKDTIFLTMTLIFLQIFQMFGIFRRNTTNAYLYLKFSDVVVTSITTLVLDFLASGNKILCYYFDRDKKIPFSNSIKRFYETLWFLKLRKLGLGNFMVANKKELFNRIDKDINSENNLFLETRKK